MAWIKRNLYFVLGSIVALALMGVGGYYLWAAITDENKVAEDITAQYAEMTRLNQLPVYPTPENIKAAKEQDASLRAYLVKARGFFQRIPPIPDTGTNKVTNADFGGQLRVTVAQLKHSAEQQSVQLSVPDYYFTFAAQQKNLMLDPASLDSLAVHLGEIKALCDILFSAKINSLDGIRREKISEINDLIPSDYLGQKTVSTPLADITPYEITFRCFSAELAQVLSKFASSPNGFLVKTINVEPTSSDLSPEQAEAAQPMMTQPRPYNPYNPYAQGEGGRRRGPPPPTMVAPTAVAPTTRPGVFLNEKPLRVTLLVHLVKLKPANAK